MLCEDYPSLFDDAKIQNDFAKCKQTSVFNILLTQALKKFTLFLSVGWRLYSLALPKPTKRRLTFV